MKNDGFGGIGDGFHPEQVKLAHTQLKVDHENNKLNKEFKDKILDSFFSAHFFVFLIIVLIISSGFIFISKVDDTKSIIEYWKVILPVITTYIGFAIGRKSSAK